MSVEYITHRNDNGRTYKTLPPLKQPVAEWLAGALEVGGAAGIAINKQREGYVSSKPFISLQDTKPVVVEWLTHNFGGTATSTGGSVGWRVGYYVAAGILLDLEPYAVSRQELIQAVKNWWDADTEGRVQIAREMKGYDRFEGLTSEQYSKLLTRPASVAGIIGYKGFVYPHHNKKYIYPRVDVYSKNRALVKAIEQRFGGTSSIKVEAGSDLAINPGYQEIKDSLQLTLSNRGARNIIGFSEPFLVAQPFEGWDRRLVEERHKERGEKATQIHQFATAELESYLRGAIFRISSAEDIAEKFALSKKTAIRRLSLLPQNIRKERERVLRSANRQELTESEIVSLADAIAREIREFQAGATARLSYSEQWANLAAVGIHIVNRHVVTRLPKELREFRQHVLQSQNASDINKGLWKS